MKRIRALALLALPAALCAAGAHAQSSATLDGAYPGTKISSWVRRRAAEDYTQGLQPSILTADQCGQRMRDLLGRASQIVN